MDEEESTNLLNKLRNKVPSKHWNLEFKILEFYYYEIIQIWGASVKDAEGIKTFMMFYKVGYEDVLLVVSAMGKPRTLLKSS
jgi:hypothetical protein